MLGRADIFLLHTCYRIVTAPLIDLGASFQRARMLARGARKRISTMTDVNFVKRTAIGVSRPTASLVSITVGGTVGGGEKPAGFFRRSIDRIRGIIRRRPLAARMLGIVCIAMIGWFLLMAPLFIAR